MQIRFDAVVDVTEVGVEPQNQWDAEASKEPIVVAKGGPGDPSRPRLPRGRRTSAFASYCRAAPGIRVVPLLAVPVIPRGERLGEISETAGLMRGLAKSGVVVSGHVDDRDGNAPCFETVPQPEA